MGNRLMIGYWLKIPRGFHPVSVRFRPPAPFLSSPLSPIPNHGNDRRPRVTELLTRGPSDLMITYWISIGFEDILRAAATCQINKFVKSFPQKILDKFFLLCFIALTLNQFAAPYIFCIPPTKPHPKKRYTGPFYPAKQSSAPLWSVIALRSRSSLRISYPFRSA